MASVNKVIIVGNLGRDPELRYTASGLAVANFSVATSDRWTDKNSGQQQERTEWHRIVVWGKQGENCGKYLKKGRSVYIEGRLQTREYPDPKDPSQKRYTTEIVATAVQFLGGGREDSGNVSVETSRSVDNGGYGAPPPEFSAGNGVGEEDIPF